MMSFRVPVVSALIRSSGKVLSSIRAFQNEHSWRQRRLIFDAERLEAVAAEFNRFNTNAMIIDDQSLKDLRISGVFEANDPESLLAFLQANEGAVLEVGADGATRVRRTGTMSR